MSAARELNETLTGLASILSEHAAFAIEPVLREKGLGFGAFDLLATVRAAEGRETQGQIAARLGIAPSSLTEAVASAVKKGLVEQLVVANNQRARRLMLTREGEQVLDACLAKLSAFETSLRQKVGASALDAAIETLRRANEAALEIHGA
jgi:DNA-binding MarR family transcriptional regulator